VAVQDLLRVESPLWSGWTLLGVLLLLRLCCPVPPTPQAWRARVDLPLVLLAGLLFALLASFYLAPLHMLGYPLTASDYAQYCEKVAAIRDGAPATIHPQRGYWAALLPALLSSRFGIQGGLALGALLSMGVIGAGLYLQGRVLHSRFAGACAAGIALGCLPVVTLSRTATFYPEIVAVTTFAVALGVAAAVLGTAPWVAAAGIGAGAALLIDVRGLPFGLVVLGLGLIGSLRPPWRPLPLRLGLLLAPIGGSYLLARSQLAPGTPGLYAQAVRFLAQGQQEAGLAQVHLVKGWHDWYWGRSSPADVPAALAAMVRLGGQAQPALAAFQSSRVEWSVLILPSALVLVVGLAGTVWLFRRRPGRMVILALAALPSLSITASATRILPAERYLASGLVGLWAVAGVGICGLLAGEHGLLPRPLRTPTALLVLALVLTGALPTWFSPFAPWRIPVGAHDYPQLIASGKIPDDPRDARCVALQAEDAAAGRSFLPYLPSTRRPLDEVMRGLHAPQDRPARQPR